MKKINIIVIITLTIISTVSIGIVIYQFKNYTKLPKQYRCETAETKTDNISYKQVIIINIDKDQYVENYQSKNVNIFYNQEQYDLAKSIENTDTITYSYDDDKKTILIDYGTNIIKDENGEKVNIWYKEYIKNLENSGFTCKMIK